MPTAQLFVRPEPLGLDIMLVGPDINWKVKAQITAEVENDEGKKPKEERNDDSELPALIPI